MLRLSLIPLLISSTIACQSTSSVITDINDEQREALFAPVRALEGRWVLDSEEHPGEITFAVSSNGSVVREIMFPGTEHEMTNMYSLDGNSLVMTHYCAGGNQPTMRASAFDGKQIVFEPESVKDLREGYDYYMGGITLVMTGDDSFEQHWLLFDEKTGEPATLVYKLVRMK